MKLIKILALATAMATMATAQNAGTNNQKKGGPTPTPTPTPAGSTKAGSKPPAGTKTPVATGQPVVTKTGTQPSATKPGTTGPVTTKAGTSMPATAKTTGTQTPVSKTGATGPSAVHTPSPRPPVKSGSLPEKATIKAKPGVMPLPQTKTAAKPVVKTKAGVVAGNPKPPVTKTPSGANAATKSTPPKVKETATGEKPKPPAGRTLGARGRRDPFISPIRNLGNVTPTPACTSGKRCLAIPELVLQGTVKDLTGKMLAVVVNSSHHTYFLRENDQVFNGSVEKITSDSIIFREFVRDPLGRESAHEVVKKLVPTS